MSDDENDSSKISKVKAKRSPVSYSSPSVLHETTRSKITVTIQRDS